MPKIKHTILLWARETAGLSIEEATHKLGIKDGKAASASEKLAALESGNKEPSRALLLRMSRVYHRPLLTFYLEKPPGIGDRGEDFRTLPDQFDAVDNAHVDMLIRDIKARQSTVRETLVDEEEGEPLAFIGKYTSEQGGGHIVQALHDILDVDLGRYRAQPSYKEAFRVLRERVEAAGIFVLLKGNLGSWHSNIAVTVFRGFALSDDVAPFIVINDQDATSAWSFTLLHEMAHLLLGQTGVSGAYADKQIEKFCNNVASEFLLPTVEFEGFQPASLETDALVNIISDYAFAKKVSRSHIAYRLYRRGDIDKEQWQHLHNFYLEEWQQRREKTKEENRQKEGGPNYYTVQRYKLGSLVELVERFAYSGALTTTKAGMLLDVRPLKVHRLFETGQSA